MRKIISIVICSLLIIQTCVFADTTIISDPEQTIISEQFSSDTTLFSCSGADGNVKFTPQNGSGSLYDRSYTDPTTKRINDDGNDDGAAVLVESKEQQYFYVDIADKVQNATHLNLSFKYYNAKNAVKNTSSSTVRDTLQIGFSNNTVKFSNSNSLFVAIQNNKVVANGNKDSYNIAKVKEWKTFEMDVVLEKGAGDNGKDKAIVKITTNDTENTYTVSAADSIGYFMIGLDKSHGGRFYFDDIVLKTIETIPDTLIEASEALTFEKISEGTNNTQSEVYEDFNFPENIGVESDTFHIDYSSDNMKAITEDGKVIRRSFGQKATLTAVIKHNERVYVTKTFDLYIKEYEGASVDEQLEDYAKEYLTLDVLTTEDKEFVTKDLFELPLGDETAGINIEWISSDENYISNTGSVTRPLSSEEDALVTLTAILTKGDAEPFEKQFEFIVKKIPDPFEFIDEAILNTPKEVLSAEDEDKITKNLYLPKKYGDVSIEWSSNSSAIDAEEGMVTRGNTEIDVVLTATFKYGGVEKTKEYFFKVLPTEEKMIEADIALIDTEGWDALTEDFEIQLSGKKYKTEFYWTSSGENIVISSNVAQVKRPPYGADAQLNLILYAVNGTSYKDKVFPVTVKCQISDQEAVDVALSELEFGVINDSFTALDEKNYVTQNFALPEEIEELGVSIEWDSDNEIVSNKGEIIRPKETEEAQKVILTANATKNYATGIREYEFYVKPFDNADEVLASATSALNFKVISNENSEEVTTDLELPQEFHHTTVEWTSYSDLVCVDGNIGIIQRPQYNNEPKTARISATLSYNGKTSTKFFNFTILEENELVETVWDENFDDLSNDYNFITDKGTWTVSSEEVDVYISDNPSGDGGKVLCVDRSEKTQGNGYVIFETNEESGAVVTIKTRIFIPEENIGQVKFDIRTGAAQIPLRINSNGELFSSVNEKTVSTDVLIKSPEKIYNKKGEWVNLKVVVNTAMKKYHVYVNDVCWTENSMVKYKNGNVYDSSSGIKYYYYEDESRTTQIKGFRINISGGDKVYFDDFNFEKRIIFTEKQKAAAKEWESEFLINNNVKNVAANLKLPVINDNSITVSYLSNNDSVIDSVGNVYPVQTPTEVKFTVLFDDGESVFEKQYILTVTKNNSNIINDDEAVKADVESVIASIKKSYLLENLKNNLSLSTSGENGSVMSYSSADENIITNTGVITRSNSAKKVVFTIKAQKNEASYSDVIEITVAKKESESGEGGSSSSASAGNKKPQSVFGTNTVKQTGISIENLSEEQTEIHLFNDVQNDFWAFDAISYLSKHGILNGTGNGDFEPQRNITREEFIKVLVLALGIDVSNITTNVFEDVDSSAWYCPYINAAYKEGLINGSSPDIFGVGVSISRQDMALMVCRATNLIKDDNSQKFNDDGEIAEYAKEAIYILRDNGIISGKGDNSFSPKSFSTRAEAATIIYKAIKNDIFK